jgi:RimJ/RimL family protein N-acetyltransferase
MCKSLLLLFFRKEDLPSSLSSALNRLMPTTTAPQSPRLIFHRHTPADYAESAALWADPATTLHIGGKPSTPEESWARLLRNIGHWHATGFGFWVVRHRETGAFAGEVGMKLFRRDLDPAWENLPEIGWALCPWAQGQGLATEATQAALAWGAQHFAWPQMLCMIDPANQPSLRVAAKCGFIEHTRRTYHNNETIILARVA